MPSTAPSPCVPWTADDSCCDGWVDYDPDLQARATTLAWDTIKVLTAGLVGSCPVAVRPCLTEPCSVCSSWWNWSERWMSPAVVNGSWVNNPCGKTKCSCERMCEVVLPGPVANIESVILDCYEIDPTQFRVDNGNRVVRQDGECWPACQNMNLLLGEIGTFGIIYTPGIAPDLAGLWAAGVLACEYAKACTGGKCRLPSSVTTVVRQGVAMTMSEGLFEGGITGIREVDAWVKSINPYARKTPSLVWSPDVPWAGHRWQTWP